MSVDFITNITSLSLGFSPKASACGICGGQTCTSTGLYLSTSVLPFQYHPAIAPHSSSSVTDATYCQQLTHLSSSVTDATYCQQLTPSLNNALVTKCLSP